MKFAITLEIMNGAACISKRTEQGLRPGKALLDIHSVESFPFHVHVYILVLMPSVPFGQ